MLIYHDLTDTTRTRDATGGDSKKAIVAALHSWVLAMLMGDVPLLSQTQGFDSSVLLAAVSAGSGEGRSFCDLVRAGHLRIHLLDEPSLPAALVSALRRDPPFRLSAWPEVEEGEVARDELADAVTSGHLGGLPRAVEDRVAAVLQLEEVRRQRPYRAHRPAWSLHGLLQPRAGAPAHPVDKLLTRMYADGAGDRTALYRIAEQNDEPPHVRRLAHHVVDGLYNMVVASSLGAQRTLLTPTEHAWRRVIERTGSEGVHRVSELSIRAVSPGLEAVTWSALHDFLSDLPPAATDDERARAAAAAGFLAREEIAAGAGVVRSVLAPVARLLHNLRWLHGAAAAGAEIAGPHELRLAIAAAEAGAVVVEQAARGAGAVERRLLTRRYTGALLQLPRN